MNISEVANNIIGDKCNCQPDEGDCHWCIQRNGIEEALKTLESEKAALIKNNQDNLVQERKGWTDTVKAKDERIKGLEAMHGLDKVALDEALSENKALCEREAKYEGDCHWCIQRNGIEDALSKLESEKDERIKELEALTSEDTPTWKSSAFQKIKGLEAENKALREQLEQAKKNMKAVELITSPAEERLQEEISALRGELGRQAKMYLDVNESLRKELEGFQSEAYNRGIECNKFYNENHSLRKELEETKDLLRQDVSTREQHWSIQSEVYRLENESLRHSLEVAREALEPFANWDWEAGSPCASVWWDEKARLAKSCLASLSTLSKKEMK
jgi:Zn-finger protein